MKAKTWNFSDGQAIRPRVYYITSFINYRTHLSSYFMNHLLHQLIQRSRYVYDWFLMKMRDLFCFYINETQDREEHGRLTKKHLWDIVHEKYFKICIKVAFEIATYSKKRWKALLLHGDQVHGFISKLIVGPIIPKDFLHLLWRRPSCCTPKLDEINK